MTLRTGGRILVDQLKIQGCDRVFTVPGESCLAVLDALHDTPEIDPII
jgi:acetolactate synthase-1/2/3 large subunit